MAHYMADTITILNRTHINLTPNSNVFAMSILGFASVARDSLLLPISYR